jgi:5-bromo-4-chloroindolyl phosphate hydrolysis protein
MSKFAEEVKKSNILDMALMFSAMIRLFAKDSKERIVQRLWDLTSELPAINTANDYEKMHREFCIWFCQEIHTAQKTLKNGKTKRSNHASFGQAAKVLDVALKVYVYFCSQPSTDVSARINPFLHGAMDTAMMKYLTDKYPEASVRSTTIYQVDEQTYNILKGLVDRDITERFHDEILPVQWDDILWQELNRETEVRG